MRTKKKKSRGPSQRYQIEEQVFIGVLGFHELAELEESMRVLQKLVVELEQRRRAVSQLGVIRNDAVHATRVHISKPLQTENNFFADKGGSRVLAVV